MPSTYEPIQTQTLDSATSTITFSSIPATYTDIRLVLVTQNTTGTNLNMRFNSNSSTLYSNTTLFGANSERASNQTAFQVGNPQSSSTNWRLFEIDIFNYTGSTFKTQLTSANLDNNDGNSNIRRIVGLWRSTSAITALSLFWDSGNHSVGTTATLYGIKNA